MTFYPDLPDYSPDMYLHGFSPEQIFEAFRRTNRKKMNEGKKKKREESILEKEVTHMIEKVAKASIDPIAVNLFKTFEL